jgi:enoyl-CoA hydratase
MIRAVHAGAVVTVVLDRPPVNAIDRDFVAAFNDVVDGIEKLAPSLVVIQSAHKCFSAGADLALVRDCFGAPAGVAAMVDYVKSLHRLFNRVERLEAVTLAVIDGPALGGGLELALSCDLRIASARAKIGLPEARVGMIPGAGGTQRLTRLCGPGVSARLILGGETVGGEEAARLGVVQWGVETEALDARVDEIVARVVGLSRPALLASKDCIAAWFDPGVDGYARELEKPWILMNTEEARARVNGFFAPKGDKA